MIQNIAKLSKTTPTMVDATAIPATAPFDNGLPPLTTIGASVAELIGSAVSEDVGVADDTTSRVLDEVIPDEAEELADVVTEEVAPDVEVVLSPRNTFAFS